MKRSKPPFPTKVDVCTGGGGPAGRMAGLLFARAGLRVLVLEKHGDFLRDFRGDTVHPSTLQLFEELGLAQGLLARPHDEAATIRAEMAGRRFAIADMRHLPVKHRFLALMPQWDFLDFVAGEAQRYPGFALAMKAEATGLTFAGERVGGVTLDHDGAEHVVSARLVIAADGRRSLLREAAALPLVELGAPMDVLWFRLPKERGAENETTGVFGQGHMIALIDRGDYWQCAWVIAKGAAEEIEARGIAAFRAEVTVTAPRVAEAVAALGSFDEVKLLSVALDRLTRWHRPGLLAIGDAAHAMSPIGGVGINLAIQDAVAAANILAAPMVAGADIDALLPQVQRRRMLATRVIQGLQRIAHDRIIGKVIAHRAADASPAEPPWALRLIDRVPLLQRIPARLIGLGIRPEHIRSPLAVAPRRRRSVGPVV